MDDPHTHRERCPSCGARLRILPAIKNNEVSRLCPACGLQPRSRGATIHTQPIVAGSHRFRRLIGMPSTDPLPEWMIEDLPRQAREQIERLSPPPGPRLGPRLSEALSQVLRGRGLRLGCRRSKTWQWTRQAPAHRRARGKRTLDRLPHPLQGL